MSTTTILVSPAGYDDVKVVLGSLGGQFAAFDELQIKDINRLSDYSFLAQYHHLFLNCHDFFNSSIDEQIIAAIRRFVENGGALYASDWASTVLENAFGHTIIFKKRAGVAKTVNARVSDPYLAQCIGSNIPICFDLGKWDSIEKFSPSSDIYLWDEGRRPLAIGFRVGLGRVIFTSFHHHAQHNEAEIASTNEQDLLKWLVTLPTQHSTMTQVGDVLAQYRAIPNMKQVVNQIGDNNHVISPKLGPKSGLGVFALSWTSNEGLELSMRFLRGGEEPEVEKKSNQPPIVMTIRNPKNEDAIDIRRYVTDLSGENPQIPYVLGASIRRDLVGDPDWLALAIKRHLAKVEFRRNTVPSSPKELVTCEVAINTLHMILEGLGYELIPESEDKEKQHLVVTARNPDSKCEEPALQILIRFLDCTESQLERSESENPMVIDVADITAPTEEPLAAIERLLVCFLFSREEWEGLQQNVKLAFKSDPPIKWELVAHESRPLGMYRDIVSTEDFSALQYVSILIYRLQA